MAAVRGRQDGPAWRRGNLLGLHYLFTRGIHLLFTRGIHLTRKRDVNQFKSSLVVAGTDEPCLFRLGAVPATCTRTATGPHFVNPLRLRDNVYESWANSF